MRDRLAAEKQGAARARQYDQQRLHHLNAEMQKVADALREVSRDRNCLGNRTLELQLEVRGGGGGRRGAAGGGGRRRQQLGGGGSSWEAECSTASQRDCTTQQSACEGPLLSHSPTTRPLPLSYQQADKGAHARRQLADAESAAASLERDLASLRRKRNEAEAALQKERAAFGSAQTTEELRRMLATLQVGPAAAAAALSLLPLPEREAEGGLCTWRELGI